MGDCTALREFGKTAERWRQLAEKRRDYFRELYRTGRWRLYYNEEEFVTRLRDVARTCDRWGVIVESWPVATEEPTAPVMQRDAA